MMMTSLSDIKRQLKLRQVVEYYGFKVNRAGFINCPIHGEKTASLKIYSNDKGFYCFGCGEGGDVITFIMKVFNIDFKTALTKISEDFGLGDTRKKLSKFEKMKIAVAEDVRKKKNKEREEIENHYEKVLDEFIRLDKNRIKYKPKKIGEPMHELFIEALQKLCYQEYLLDIAETRLRDYEFGRTDS